MVISLLTPFAGGKGALPFLPPPHGSRNVRRGRPTGTVSAKNSRSATLAGSKPAWPLGLRGLVGPLA
jgi:hypothetical protein